MSLVAAVRRKFMHGRHADKYLPRFYDVICLRHTWQGCGRLGTVVDLDCGMSSHKATPSAIYPYRHKQHCTRTDVNITG